MSHTTCVLGPDFSALFDRLVSDLRDAKDHSRLLRIAIVVPGRELLWWVRTELTRRLGGERLLGIEVITLYGLANKLAPRGMPDPVDGEVQHLLLSTLGKPPSLSAIDRPEAMLLAAFSDLRDAGVDVPQLEGAAEALSDDPWWERGREVLELYARWRHTALSLKLLSRSDVVRAAAEAVREPGARVPFDRLAWFGVYDLTGAMAELVNAACRVIPGIIYYPEFEETGSLPALPETADQYLRETFDSVIAPVSHEVERLESAPLSPVITRADASAEEGELTAVARALAVWAQGEIDVDWGRVAIVARDLAPYLSPGRRVFRRFGIPLAPSRPVPGRVRGRVRGLLAVCDIAREGLRRDSWLDAVRFGGPSGRAAYGRWLGPLDAALRQVGVVADKDWDTLLAHLQGEGVLRMPAPVSDESDAAAPIAAEVVQGLITHVEAIRSVVADWPDCALPAKHAAHWTALVQAVTGTQDEHTERVAEAIRACPVMVTRRAFLASAERVLQRGAPEPRQEGVRFMDVMSARGMTFDQVFVVGLNRRRWPRHVREDPIIPDRVRKVLRRDLGLDSLPIKERGHAEELLLFRLVMGSARDRLTLIHQRSDTDGRAQVPSPLLDTVGACDVDSVPRRRVDALRPLVEAGSLAMSRADRRFWAAVTKGPESADTLAQLSPDADRRVILAAGLAALVLRDDVKGLPGRFDGLVGGGWAGPSPPPLAPTRMEDYLRCPWQGFVRHGLGLEPINAPGELPAMDRLRLGLVVHRVHERLVAWLARAGELDEELTWEDARALAERWGQEALSDSLVDEPIVAPLLRALLGPEIDGRLTALTALLRSRYAEHGRQPLEAERHLRGSVELKDGRVVSIHARADRFDGPAPEVADVKTGRPPRSDRELLRDVARGRRLQAAFYHWLSQPRWAGYEFLSENGTFSRVGLSDVEWIKVEPSLRRVLGVADALLRQGTFVHRKGRHCGFCEVSTTCTRQHRPAGVRLERLDERPMSELNPQNLTIRLYRLIAEEGVEL